MRLRHSIGSPGGLLGPQMSLRHTQQQRTPSEEHFGDGEADMMMVMDDDLTTPHDDEAPPTLEELTEFLGEAQIELVSGYLEDGSYNVIVQRSRFWERLLRQKFDVCKKEVKVIFAGEAAADTGGPLREFLTLFCRGFSSIPGLVAGSKNNLFFKMLPLAESSGHYFMIGQLAALAIIKIGRGPECLNSQLVKCMFGVNCTGGIVHDDGELTAMLARLESGDTEVLLDLDIPLSIMSQLPFAKQLVERCWLIKRHTAAILQFRTGLDSVVPLFRKPGSKRFLRHFLVGKECTRLQFQEFRNLLHYENNELPDSNQHRVIEDLICDMELYLAAVANGEKVLDEKTISLNDILFLLTGLDRIPPFGLPQKITISFSTETPQFSTCGFFATLPMEKIDHFFDIAIKFGGGFGSI